MSFKYSALVVAGVAFAAPATAADLGAVPAPAPAPAVSMFDFAAGGKLMSDYNFRGISQSDRKPSGTAYFEGRFNLNETFQFYAAAQAWAVKLPSDPSAEVDLYGGVRATFGAFAFDVGVMRYWYPGETELPNALQPRPRTTGQERRTSRSSTARRTYTFNEMFTFGANVFYAPNWLNTGADGTYVSGTAKVTLPYDFSVSGELGRYFLGTTDAFYGFFEAARLHLLEHRPDLHLQGRLARPALPRHEPEQERSAPLITGNNADAGFALRHRQRVELLQVVLGCVHRDALVRHHRRQPEVRPSHRRTIMARRFGGAPFSLSACEIAGPCPAGA